MQSVTLLGLGTMGAGMGERLLGAGFPLTVWNRSVERTRPLAAAGAGVADTPRAAAAGADVVVSMLADDAVSRDVWLGDDGALAGTRSGTLLIECSTVSPGWIRELGAAASERGCVLVDAPVTGSRTQAASGQLLFLAGGEAADIERANEVLMAMGRAVTHIGPAGSGAFVKLVNNFVCGVQVAAIAEAVALIEASGVDRDKALAVLLDGAPGSPLVKGVTARMLAQDYDVHFRVDLMGKDLSYAMEEGTRHHVVLVTAAAALQRFVEASRNGLGGRDIAAVVEPLRPGHPA
ncbi:MAG: NAD(P)-dependent oxidoreductase [Gemmatimonadota bacterium]